MNRKNLKRETFQTISSIFHPTPTPDNEDPRNNNQSIHGYSTRENILFRGKD